MLICVLSTLVKKFLKKILIEVTIFTKNGLIQISDHEFDLKELRKKKKLYYQQINYIVFQYNIYFRRLIFIHRQCDFFTHSIKSW